MNKSILKKALKEKTGCAIQYNGWTCGTCFFNISDQLTNQDWQALLLFRGDYEKDSFDNLPDDIDASLEKILSLCK